MGEGTMTVVAGGVVVSLDGAEKAGEGGEEVEDCVE